MSRINKNCLPASMESWYEYSKEQEQKIIDVSEKVVDVLKKQNLTYDEAVQVLLVSKILLGNEAKLS